MVQAQERLKSFKRQEGAYAGALSQIRVAAIRSRANLFHRMSIRC